MNIFIFINNEFLNPQKFLGAAGCQLKVKTGIIVVKYVDTQFTCNWTHTVNNEIKTEPLPLPIVKGRCLLYIDTPSILEDQVPICSHFTHKGCLIIGGVKNDTKDQWVSGLLEMNENSKVFVGKKTLLCDGEKIFEQIT